MLLAEARSRTLRLLAPISSENLERVAGDIRHCFAATERARRLLGFSADVELDDGLPELPEWVARQAVDERGDEARADLRRSGLVS